MFKLVISDDEGKTTVVPLVHDEVTIGRKEGNTVRLTERNISRRHARLLKKNGKFVIEDLGSYNGVRINGQRIDADATLRSGDRLEIGDYRIDFEDDRFALARTDPQGLAPSMSLPPPRLVMIGAPAPGAEFSLSQQKLRIGRDENLEIWVNHKSISREHAEIRVDGGKVTIFDLDSANGLRVNGHEAPRANLKPGDVVEVGEVQFRYVPSQESHSFESAPTEVDVEIISERPAARRAPVVVLATLAAIVLIGGGAVLGTLGDWDLFGFTEPEEAPRGLPTLPSDPAAVADPPPPAQDPPTLELGEEQRTLMFAAAQEACQRAVEQARWGDAIRYADQALSLEPGSSQATACLKNAQAGVEESATLEEAEVAFEEGRVDEAFAIASSLPLQSPLRASPEYSEIQNSYIDQHLEAAKKALATKPAAAQQEASHILTLDRTTRTQKREAERILSQARAKLARAAARRQKPPRAKPKPLPPSRPVVVAPKPKPEPPPRVVTPVAPKPTPSKPTGGLAAARDCLRAGDNSCVVRALENGQADSAPALALLIETYRSMGNDGAAKRHMRTFVRRYPTDRRAARYEQILAIQ